MDIPQNIDEALQVAAWLEALGPAFPSTVEFALRRDVVNPSLDGQLTLTMGLILPIVETVALLERQLQAAEQHVIEVDAVLAEFTAAAKELARREETELDPGRLREDGPVTSVEWRGGSTDYFENMEAINHQLAQGVSEMARQQVDRLQETPPEGADRWQGTPVIDVDGCQETS